MTTPSGKRADAVNFDEAHVKELKPDNPRAIKRGEKQADGYAKDFEKNDPSGRKWTSSVETYKPQPKPKPQTQSQN